MGLQSPSVGPPVAIAPLVPVLGPARPREPSGRPRVALLPVLPAPSTRGSRTVRA